MTAVAAAPIVLVAHGSRDPRAAAATRDLARAVVAVRPGLDVHVAYLDHGPPPPGEVLRTLEAAGHRQATLIPLLLTAAYHSRVDIPGTISAARAAGLRMPVRVTEVLGPATGVVDPLLLAGLRRRLTATGADFDAVVLAAAGTRDPAARGTVDQAAGALGATLRVPCLAAYASAGPPATGEAVALLRRHGARRVAVAAYFLAPGRLYEAAAASARGAGAVAVAAPLEGAPEIARLVLTRAAFPVDQGLPVALSRSSRADWALIGGPVLDRRAEPLTDRANPDRCSMPSLVRAAKRPGDMPQGVAAQVVGQAD